MPSRSNWTGWIKPLCYSVSCSRLQWWEISQTYSVLAWSDLRERFIRWLNSVPFSLSSLCTLSRSSGAAGWHKTKRHKHIGASPNDCSARAQCVCVCVWGLDVLHHVLVTVINTNQAQHYCTTVLQPWSVSSRHRSAVLMLGLICVLVSFTPSVLYHHHQPM